MRENRLSGSEGGGPGTTRFLLPLFTLRPFGALAKAGADSTTFQASPLIRPPALRGVSDSPLPFAI
jgi:hypothetical protein